MVKSLGPGLSTVVTHSMGGFFAAKLMIDGIVPGHCKFVLLQPLLQQPPGTWAGLSIPSWLASLLAAPYCMGAPLSRLFSRAGFVDSYLRDWSQWRMVRLAQCFYCRDNMPTLPELTRAFQKYDVRVMAANDDKLSGFSDEFMFHLIETCSHVTLISAKHEPFNDYPTVQAKFRVELALLLHAPPCTGRRAVTWKKSER
jgi:hypothetical protein